MAKNLQRGVAAGDRGIFQRLHSARLLLWWSAAWAIGVFALAPLMNYVTPFLDQSYANQWTPDVYWRLVLYWHGAIFIPWIVVLAVLVTCRFHLDETDGMPGRLIRESVFVGGFLAVPIAGVAGIFDVYDQFALGIPLWTQIFAFLIGDEIAISLLVAMIAFPRSHGGYMKAGMPFYTVLIGVAGALTAAMLGHVGGYITWFGPNPSIVNQYINSTMYPVLGYSNSSSIIMFTEDVVGSHSHLMMVALMAGVVALVAMLFGGYETWGKNTRRVANVGFAVMIVALLTALWMYVVSGVGNYQIPSFFVNGVNGVAGDDLTTGTVGLGAVFVLGALLAESRRRLTAGGTPFFRDALFVSVIVAWITIYLVIPVTGFYINFNETFYQAAGLNFDDAFLRFHQDFGFFVLPAIVTMALALDFQGISGRARNAVGYLFMGGTGIAFVFGEVYALGNLSDWAYYLAWFGGFVIGTGVAVGVYYLARASAGRGRMAVEIPASREGETGGVCARAEFEDRPPSGADMEPLPESTGRSEDR